MLRYSDIKAFTQDGLTGLGYGTQNPDIAEPARSMPAFLPGPATIELLQKTTPQALVFLTLGNGVGLTTETLYDKPFITVRTIGQQGDYDFAEKLAQDIDGLYLDVASPVSLGGTRVLYITRTGGAPQLVDFDSANRYHFQATYITEAQR